MNQEKITSWQFFLITLNYAVGTALFVRPGGLIATAKQDAWMIPLLVGAGSLLAAWLWIALAKANPGKSLVQICLQAGGKAIGGTLALVYVWYFVTVSGWVTRNLGDFMKTILMRNTPISVFHLMFLAVAAYAVIKGVETIARTSEFLTPLVVVFLVVIYLLTLKDWTWARFEPPLQLSVSDIVRSSLPLAGFPYLECVALLMLVPHAEGGIKKGLLWGFAVTTALLSLIVFITIGVLGVTRASHTMYPLYTIVQELRIAEFIEHVESTIVIVWLSWIFLKLCTAYYAAVAGLCELLRVRDRTWIAVPLVGVISGFAVSFNENVVENIEWDTRYIFIYSSLFGIVLPAILLIVTRWKARASGRG